MADKRADAWKLGAGWNETFEWYAKAILELQSREITDRTSWRYLAAMHGFRPDWWIGYGLIDDTTPLPSDDEQEAAWNQCQHGGYYFLPWHRGYLARFEAIVAAAVEKVGGPPGWKLPYWNYLDATNPDARRIPDAFLEEFMPDGVTANPLSNLPRFGQTVLGPEPGFGIDDITLDAMAEPDFSGSVSFGGPETSGFDHWGIGNGALESNPHGAVHVLVGGAPPVNPGLGYMSRFETAGLDPIFWLHHCNLDRLWEAWLGKAGVHPETGQAWLDGPFAPDKPFLLPTLDGTGLKPFTSRETLRGGSLYVPYDDLTAGTGVTPAPGAAAVAIRQGPATMANPKLIGANDRQLELGDAPAATVVRIAAAEHGGVATAMGPGEAAVAAGRLYLRLENIRGADVAGGIAAYLNPPSATELPDANKAGGAALFGLGAASDVDGGHGGNGISLTFDITDLARRLAAEGNFDPEHLDVKVKATHSGGDDKPVTVERVTVLRG